MGGLGKIEPSNDFNVVGQDKKESIKSSSDSCTFGFNQIVRIKIIENKFLESSSPNSDSIMKPDILINQDRENNKKESNPLSVEFSNSNNSYCIYNESDLIAENKEINDFLPKKTHSVEHLVIEQIKFSDGSSKSKNETTFGVSKVVNLNFKEKTMETMSLQGSKSVDNSVKVNSAVEKNNFIYLLYLQ